MTKLNTVIFDMDGLLIDSEPLWGEAATIIFKEYGIVLTPQQYHTTTGLRTKEFVKYWFKYFNISLQNATVVETLIVNKVIELVHQKGRAMPGLQHIFNFFIHKQFKIGLASSSSMELINMVVEKLKIGSYLHSVNSAENLLHGKPHPEVYLNCASELKSIPEECICFEDSFPGLIAVKAARMKCVLVPDAHNSKDVRWQAADLKIASLTNFNELLLQSLQN